MKKIFLLPLLVLFLTTIPLTAKADDSADDDTVFIPNNTKSIQQDTDILSVDFADYYFSVQA